MRKSKQFSLPEPIIKEENGQYRAYFKYFNKKGKKANTNGGLFKSKKVAREKALLRQARSIAAQKSLLEIADTSTIAEAMVMYRNVLSSRKDEVTGDKDSLTASDYENIGAIINNYSYNYGNIKIKDIDGEDFREWIEDIDSGRNRKRRPKGTRVNKLRTTLYKFAEFLKREKIIDNLTYDDICEKLGKADIQGRTDGVTKVKEEELYTYEDIVHLVDSFKKETFEDWWMYAFLMTAFFTCMRLSELMALRWKHIDFMSCFITVEDGITKRENRENVAARAKKGHFEAKNKFSKRDIPMMHIFYYILKDYRQQYKIKFDLKYGSKEFDNAFVFPAFQDLAIKNDKDKTPVYMRYTNTQWINRQLKRLCDKTSNSTNEYTEEPINSKVEYAPARLLRHSGCTHLAKYHDYLETELSDYMGHSFRGEGAMVRDIYEKLEPREKGYRTRNRHPELYIVNPAFELEKRIKNYDLIAELIDTNTRKNVIRNNRMNSIFENIDYLYHVKDQREYYYTADQKWITEEWLSTNPDIKDMKFKAEKERPEDVIDFSAAIDVEKAFDDYRNAEQKMIDTDPDINYEKKPRKHRTQKKNRA